MQRSDRVDKQNAGVRPKASASCRTDRLFHQLQKQLAPSLCETRLEIDAQPAVVRADEVLVNCLLRNLIGNAKKAAPRDRTVRVKGVQKGSRYCVTVSDRGCGIPEEEMDHRTVLHGGQIPLPRRRRLRLGTCHLSKDRRAAPHPAAVSRPGGGGDNGVFLFGGGRGCLTGNIQFLFF